MSGRALYIFVMVTGLAHSSTFAEPKTLHHAPRRGAKVLKQAQTIAHAKGWELRTAPIALLASWYTLDISYRLTNQIATGPAAVAFRCNGAAGMLMPCWNGYALGWQGYYYFRSLTGNTPYLSMHAYYDSFKSYAHDVSNSHDDVKGFRVHAFYGYMFHAPIDVVWHFGAGWEVRNYDRTTVHDTPTATSLEQRTVQSLSNPMLEAKVGYQF